MRRQASIASKKLKNWRRKSKQDDTFIEKQDDALAAASTAPKQKAAEAEKLPSPDIASSTTTIITTTTKRPRDLTLESRASQHLKRQRVSSGSFQPQQQYHLQQQYHIDFNINQALPAHELSFASYHNMVYPPPPPPPPQIPSFSESSTPVVGSTPQYTYDGIHLMPGFVPEDSSDHNRE